ncbi:MAG: hypothetical protein KKE17_15635 [Proteobacteria bacterium]|nr:hypothetical protein [Pseudomonadota bacterium]
MSHVLTFLEGIENSGSPSLKIRFLANLNDEKRLKTLIYLTYNYFHTFGIKVKEKYDNKPTNLKNDNFEEFMRLLHCYKNRDLTGNVARDAWDRLYSILSDGERKWYTRVLNRDLKCGVNIKSINKAWPGFIDEFLIMLANPIKERKIKFPIAVEPKLDGMRAIFFISKKSAKARSRDGFHIQSLDFIAKRYQTALEDLDTDTWVIDGEIYTSSWNKTISLVKTEVLPKEERNKIRHHVFDMLKIEDFNGARIKNYSERMTELDEFFCDSADVVNKYSVRVPYKIIHNHEELTAFYNECLEAGYEGIMLKELDSYYELKRSNAWLKMKPEETFDGKIIGFLEGKNKHIGRLGAFKVKMENDEIVRVGGGFTDKQREEYWLNKDMLLGTMVEFKGQGNDVVTKSARFAVFKRFREDRIK